MKKIIIIAMIVAVSLPAFADTIKLKSGSKFKGQIVEQDEEYIKVDVGGGNVFKYALEDIEEIIPSQKPAGGSSVSQAGGQKAADQIFTDNAPAVVVIYAYSSEGMSQGSGFIVDPGGVVITNFHVVAGQTKIIVKTKDGQEYPVSGIVDYDALRDICVLKINPGPFPVVALGDSETMVPGETVYVVGAPLGMEYSISNGLYSGLRQEVIDHYPVMQFSAAISSGNSGGPLFNAKGEVIGITTLTNVSGQNLNFAVAMNSVRSYIKHDIKYSMVEFASTVSTAYYYNIMAQELIANSELQLAEESLIKGLQIDGNFIPLYVTLHDLYNMTGDLEKRIDVARQAIAVNPDLEIFHRVLGTAYFEKGMYEMGLQETEKAYEINPTNIHVLRNLGAMYEKMGDLVKAEALTRQALKILPNDPEILSNLGYVCARLGKEEDAMDLLERAVALDPNNETNALMNLQWLQEGMP